MKVDILHVITEMKKGDPKNTDVTCFSWQTYLSATDWKKEDGIMIPKHQHVYADATIKKYEPHVHEKLCGIIIVTKKARPYQSLVSV